MEQGVYIFKNNTAFIDVMATLEAQHTLKINQCKTIYLTKHFNSVAEVKKEIEFLNNCVLNCFQGFRADKLIKINIELDSINYNIVYSFNNSENSNSCFGKLYRYFRKREHTYI